MISKEELVKMLQSLNVPFSESTPDDDNMEDEFRICFWDYIWDSETASGTEYNTVVTYQISVISDKPRHEKLIELKNKLNKEGIFPKIQHEYYAEKRRFHSFFSIDVVENIV